jgi:hypothetical protein
MTIKETVEGLAIAAQEGSKALFIGVPTVIDQVLKEGTREHAIKEREKQDAEEQERLKELDL